jgi:hypothetical protein
MTVKAVWHVVKESAKRIGVVKLSPHDCDGRTRLCHASGAAAADQSVLRHVSVQTTERHLGCKQRIRSAVVEGSLATFIRAHKFVETGHLHSVCVGICCVWTRDRIVACIDR